VQELVDTTLETENKNLGDPDRYTLLQHEVVAYTEKETSCARSHQVIEDRTALKRSGERAPMVREILSLVCVHPSNKNMVVTLTYAHRYQPGYRDPMFIDNADRVFRSLAFSKLD
jgi:hypothetical protein